MSEIKLKPCPFCGAPAFLWRTVNGYKVSCEKDCVTIPPRFDVSFTSPDEAVKHWNRRTDYNLALDDAKGAVDLLDDRLFTWPQTGGKNQVKAAIERLRKKG